MKSLLLLLLSMATFSKPHAQNKSREIENDLRTLAQNFNGTIGIYVKDLRRNKTIEINADSLFPTASLVKIPIAVAIMDKINKGELSYHQKLVYRDSLLFKGEDILGSFKDGEKIELSKVFMLMLTTSDNTASLWLQSLAGGGQRINAIMDSIGFPKTRVNSKTPGREEARNTYGWGQTTPEETAVLVEKIYRSEVVSKAASDRLLRSLNKNYWDGESISEIPPYATTFSKSGAIDASRSEVVLVRGIKSNYVFCICTKKIKDQIWENNNEAWQLTRKISAMLWNYFEKNDDWKPALNAGKFN